MRFRKGLSVFFYILRGHRFTRFALCTAGSHTDVGVLEEGGHAGLFLQFFVKLNHTQFSVDFSH